jgi:altronate hydrolase
MKERVLPFLKIHPEDNVLVALKDLSTGTPIEVNNYNFKLREDIAAKHKFFTLDMNEGDEVIMYGVLVGKTQTNIRQG